MKRTLVIMRHARAESFGIVASDFERTLVPKGVLEAKQTGKSLRKAGVTPHWMAASSAPRALYSLRIALMEMGLDPEQIHPLKELYDENFRAILRTIHSIPDDIDSAIICGHNPAVSEALAKLCFGTETLPLLSTAEAVILETESESWAEETTYTLRLHLQSQDRR